MMRYYPGADSDEPPIPKGTPATETVTTIAIMVAADITITMKDDPRYPGKHIDPETGIWPISEWGPECRRGFVSNERFARTCDKVIKRANRSVTRRWYQKFAQPQKTA